jgi:hypothetical protein
MNAFNIHSAWYWHPLADWCRRTKVKSPYNRPISLHSLKVVGYAGTFVAPYAVRLTSADGELWELKEVKFNPLSRIGLWLFGFRRMK